MKKIITLFVAVILISAFSACQIPNKQKIPGKYFGHRGDMAVEVK